MSAIVVGQPDYKLESMDLRLKLVGGQLSLSPEMIELCHICSYNVIETEVRFVLECPVYNPVRGKFP
jgi:hypothetical protein